MTCTDSPTTTAYDNLVQLAVSLRPTWQAPGVKAAIRKALEREAAFTFADLAYAVAFMAGDKDQKTPAPLAFDGPWWKRAATSPAGTPWPARCSVCSYPRATCRQLWGDDHEFSPNSRGLPGTPPPDLSPVHADMVAAREALCTLHGAAICTTCDRAKQAAETNEEAAT